MGHVDIAPRWIPPAHSWLRGMPTQTCWHHHLPAPELRWLFWCCKLWQARAQLGARHQDGWKRLGAAHWPDPAMPGSRSPHLQETPEIKVSLAVLLTQCLLLAAHRWGRIQSSPNSATPGFPPCNLLTEGFQEGLESADRATLPKKKRQWFTKFD